MQEEQKSKNSEFDKVKKGMKENPLVSYVAIALVCGLAGAFFEGLGALGKTYMSFWGSLCGGFVVFSLLGICIVYPFVLSIINLVGVFRASKSETGRRIERRFELFTILLGTVYTLLVIEVSEIQMDAQWFEQLNTMQVHQPIWSQAAPTVIVLCCVGIAGYLLLSCVDLRKMPPLVTVLSISAMYLGLLECILWMIQIMGSYWILCVFPANCVLIGFKTIRYKIYEWNRWEEEKESIYQENNSSDKPFLKAIHKILGRASLWPLLALLFMWPLLGILLMILVLFGQKPDAIIKAWTETADWRLSQQIPPPSVMYDGHYLCTVAAGGHKRIVKPLRMGVRHGHSVVVNRQLCIANAFEQILEERTPGFHRAVRKCYDTYGFPVAKLILTKWAADVVYFIMKPLEWIFLIVIYLCDVSPENRIAVQYLPQKGK